MKQANANQQHRAPARPRHLPHSITAVECFCEELFLQARYAANATGVARHMPELSRFLGIVVAMYYRDHGPAHFHAIYGGFEVTVEVESGKVNGQCPKRALAHVQEWRELHRQELLEAWSDARASRPLKRIEPLE